MTENIENIDIMVGIIVVLGVLAGICHNLQDKIDWLKKIWRYLAGVTAITCVYVIFVLGIQIFKFGEDGSQGAEPEEPVTPEVIAPQTRERKLAYYERNDHCAGPKNVRWEVRADEGWEIDVNSIKVKATSISSRSSYNGVQNVNKNGFDIVGRVVNHGSCISVLGKVVAKDGRGSLRVYGSYREIR